MAPASSGGAGSPNDMCAAATYANRVDDPGMKRVAGIFEGGKAPPPRRPMRFLFFVTASRPGCAGAAASLASRLAAEGKCRTHTQEEGAAEA